MSEAKTRELHATEVTSLLDNEVCKPIGERTDCIQSLLKTEPKLSISIETYQLVIEHIRNHERLRHDVLKPDKDWVWDAMYRSLWSLLPVYERKTKNPYLYLAKLAGTTEDLFGFIETRIRYADSITIMACLAAARNDNDRVRVIMKMLDLPCVISEHAFKDSSMIASAFEKEKNREWAKQKLKASCSSYLSRTAAKESEIRCLAIFICLFFLCIAGYLVSFFYR